MSARPFPPFREELARLATRRGRSLFGEDMALAEAHLTESLRSRRVLVVGGAGTIGAATVDRLSRYELSALHVVDINENGLTELVRDLRSRAGGLSIADFRTLPLDFGSSIMEQFVAGQGVYDYVLNFAAVKHVRSEKDAYSLLHMLETNVLKPARLLAHLAARGGVSRYFSVSTDKAANPVNLMGASKRLMEHTMFSDTVGLARPVATSARFANVAFSDGSLLDGWLKRLQKRQPLAVPRDTRRFFVSPQESGELCLLAAVYAPHRHILIPHLESESDLHDLESIAVSFLHSFGLRPEIYSTEDAARASIEHDLARGHYPLLVTPLDTSGEKPYEEFVGAGEQVVSVGLPNLRGIPYRPVEPGTLDAFLRETNAMLSRAASKAEIIASMARVVSELDHIETGHSLDQRM